MILGRRAPGLPCVLVALLWASVSSAAVAADEGLYLTDPLTGREVRVDQGEPLLHLVFFATWCPDCLEELDPLNDYADRWTDRGYRLVLVAIAERQTADRLNRFIENRNPRGRVLFDPDGKLVATLNVSGVPTHVLLDAQGREIDRFDNAAAVATVIEARLRGPGR